MSATDPTPNIRAAATPGPPTGSPETTAALVPTPFVSSWFARARPGDLHDPDPSRRSAAWAQWALSSIGSMTGSANRPYHALMLPGRFYDPHGTAPQVPPHLEIPTHLFDKTAPDFPDRLAQLGNGLLFPWWLVPETLAAKRALFSVPRATPSALYDLLNNRRVGLREALITATDMACELWGDVEDTLISAPEQLSDLAARDFTAEEVAAYWPAAAELNLRIEFDTKLRDSQKHWVSRRVGVWRIVGHSDEGSYALGVITPRLTRSSLFSDELFAPVKESPAASLVRGLILTRLTGAFSNSDVVVVPDPQPTAPGGGLRAVVARVGEKLPEASVAAACKFLRDYPDAHVAWGVVEKWANSRGSAEDPAHAVLTVTREGFLASHRAASRAIRRAEDPDRDDINVLLPLAWDASARVVRVTYSPRP